MGNFEIASSKVRLLTHDTTPQLVAEGLNLTVDLIADDWLLPPESTKTEKKLKSLENEIARLKQSEPSFSIRFLDQTDTDAERYQASYTWFEPLTDAEVDELMQCLRDHFPLETDFGSREPAERATRPTITNLLLGAIQTFVPATNEAIEEYRDVTYPQWIESCEETLRNHHWSLQRESPALEFSFIAVNRGTRPATDALITITAKGDFQIKPPSADGDDGHEAEDDESSSWKGGTLPGPPVAPSGHWRNTGGLGLQHIDALLARSVFNSPDLTHSLSGINKYGSLTALAQQSRSRDANAFYYKPDCPSIPLDAFSLECEQWRHDDGEERFVGEIHVRRQRDDAKGVLICRIQAANLSSSKSKTIPVRIATTHVSAFQSAGQMVEGLLKKRVPPKGMDI